MSGAETALAVFALGSAGGAATSLYRAATLWRGQSELSRAVLAGVAGKIVDRAASPTARVLYVDVFRPGRPCRDRSFRRPVIVSGDASDPHNGGHFVRHLAVLHSGADDPAGEPLVIDALDSGVDVRLRSASRPLWRGGLAQVLNRCGLAARSHGNDAIDDGNLYQVSEAPLTVAYCVAAVPLDQQGQVSFDVDTADPAPDNLPTGQHIGLAFTREAAADAVSRMLAHDALRGAQRMAADCALGTAATCALWCLVASY
ncbi:hypothetical protein pdul_cds_407 [Pandoravirus dulcis]|uniref:Uncharacterized protein n=1 Tax=Pandoravirus dulcis TaxID=1349409 RepID=S4VWK9_9VIRU|nr:hypothetical protein pdul_cds_407 [Pandoravirus dulcis]AGO82451.1 hypothetical protein pdul_cds_407 [Pandoravirus dulcis]